MKLTLIIDDEIAEPDSSESVAEEGKPTSVGYMTYYIDALKRKGFEVITATNVDDALDILASKPVEMTIIDVMMELGQRFSDLDKSAELQTGVHLAKLIHSDYPSIDIFLLSNAVSSRPGTPNAMTYDNLVEEGIVQEIFFKLDTTPNDMVERLFSNLKRQS